MTFFMTLYLIAIIILEIAILIYIKKSKKKNTFKVFNGLFWSFYISQIVYAIYWRSDLFRYDTGEWITMGEMIKNFFLCLINFILGIIGFIFQKKAKNNQNYIEENTPHKTIYYTILVSIVTSLLIVFQYSFRYVEKRKIDNEIMEKTIDYLKEKYSSDDFKILDINRHFGANGFIGTDNLEEYNIKSIYNLDDTEFYIDVKVDDKRKIIKDSYEDTLMYAYFKKYFDVKDFINNGNDEKEKLNKYLNEKQINVKLQLNQFYKYTAFDVLPDKKMPSKIELYNLILDYHIKHELTLKIAIDEIKGDNVETELEKYLMKVSYYIIDYYKDLNDFKMTYNYNRDKKNNYIGELYIDKDYIKIKIKNRIIKEKIK